MAIQNFYLALRTHSDGSHSYISAGFHCCKSIARIEAEDWLGVTIKPGVYITGVSVFQPYTLHLVHVIK